MLFCNHIIREVLKPALNIIQSLGDCLVIQIYPANCFSFLQAGSPIGSACMTHSAGYTGGGGVFLITCCWLVHAQRPLGPILLRREDSGRFLTAIPKHWYLIHIVAIDSNCSLFQILAFYTCRPIMPQKMCYFKIPTPQGPSSKPLGFEFYLYGAGRKNT